MEDPKPTHGPANGTWGEDKSAPSEQGSWAAGHVVVFAWLSADSEDKRFLLWFKNDTHRRLRLDRDAPVGIDILPPALKAFFDYQLEGSYDPTLLQPESIPLVIYKRSRSRWRFW